MSAVITDTPITIDSINFSRQASNETGPFEFAVGDNVYQVLINNQVPATARISIYKSIDGGSSWTEMDQAGTPSNIQGQLIAFQETNGNIDILFRRSVAAGDGLQVVQFSTSTDTYGTASSASAAAHPMTGVFYRQSGGTYVYVYTDGTLRYMTNSGGVWAGPTSLRAATGLLTGVADSSDRCHLFTNEVGFQITYRQLSSSFVLGSATTFTGNAFLNGGGYAIVWDPDSVAVIYGTDSGTEKVQIGTPLSAPVFTAYDGVFPVDSVATYSYLLLVQGSDGKLNAFIIAVENPDLIDEIRQAVFDGVSTWASPIVFYDELTDPPPNSIPSMQFLHTASAVQINGNWIFATAMETSTDGGETVFCTGFALIQPICPPETGTPGSLPTNTAPNPPGSCIPWTPTTPRASFVFYDMPLEKQGS